MTKQHKLQSATCQKIQVMGGQKLELGSPLTIKIPSQRWGNTSVCDVLIKPMLDFHVFHLFYLVQATTILLEHLCLTHLKTQLITRVGV